MRHALATILMLVFALAATQALASYLANRPPPASRSSEPYEPPPNPSPRAVYFR